MPPLSGMQTPSHLSKENWHMPAKTVKADICLILEGTYPYAMGGVSTWTHELIRTQSHLTFAIVALASADAPAKLLYELPPNVVGLTTLRLQCMPKGKPALHAD